MVMGFTLEFRVGSISPEPFERFSLNFTQMFLSVTWSAEPMTQLCKHKVNVMGFCDRHLAVFQTAVLSRIIYSLN